MRKGGPVNRRGRRRRERRRILIVTEGAVTEHQYLEGLAQHLRASGIQISSTTVKKAGGEPSLVLKTARDIRVSSAEDFDATWIVVDVDEHSKLPTVLTECGRGGELAAVSNPQFEVWLLWHYVDSAKPHTKSSLEKALASHGFGKSKHLPADFPYANVESAMRFALHADRSAEPNVQGRNPSSGMAHLVRAIQGG